MRINIINLRIMKEIIKKKVLITGALGQDGIIISKILKKQNYSVIGLIKKNDKVKIQGVKYFDNNLKNSHKLKYLIKKISPNYLIHFASVNNSFHNPKNNDYKKLYLDNILISKNIINLIIENNKNTKIVFIGSSQMFSLPKKNIIDEKTKFKSSHYYGKYKIFIHNYLMKLKKKYKLNATSLILFNHDSKFRNKKFLLPRLVNAFKKKNKKFIEEIYNENIKADLSHAEDICNAIALCLKSKKNSDKLILSSNKITSINDIIIYLMNKTKLKINFEKRIKKNKNFLIGKNIKAISSLRWKIKKSIYKAVDEIFLSS